MSNNSPFSNSPTPASPFRQEALLFSSRKALGKVTLIQPLKTKILTALITVVVGLVATFLFLGNYARKETVQGYIFPDHGVVDVFPSSSGLIVSRVFVAKGDTIRKGDPLVELRSPDTYSVGRDASSDFLNELNEQRDGLLLQLNRHAEYFIDLHASKKNELKNLVREKNDHLGLKVLQEERVEIANKLTASLEQLQKKGAISKTHYLEAVADQLEQEKALIRLGQSVLKLEQSISSKQLEIRQVPVERENLILETKIRLSQTSQKITEVLGRRDELILAPVSGKIAASQIYLGAPAIHDKSIFSIVPEGSKMDAVLLVPSSAAGFIDQGQTIRLMFEAYPFQEFGTQPAVLTSISNAALPPSLLDSPIEVVNPMFVVRATLERDRIRVLGRERELQSGMLISADIILEQRSLLDWLLEPLYSLKGRT